MAVGDKQKVLFIGDLNRELAEYQQFEQEYDCVHYKLTTAEDFIRQLSGPLNDIVAIYGAWQGFFLLGGLNGNLLEACPPLLRVISICLVGHENYDGRAMRAREIVLTNVPLDKAAEPVADLVLYYALASFRQFQIYGRYFNAEMNHTLRTRRLIQGDGPFDCAAGKVSCATKDLDIYDYGEQINDRKCMSPSGHHAVIVGFGNIGRTIASRLAAIGMRISYVKRNPLSESETQSLGFDAQYFGNIKDTTAFADLVVIACPGTPETQHLVNAELIDAMAKPFRIINIGRGSVIDEDALVGGLERGKILFAGLDVFEKEPEADIRLFNRDDVMMTPHIGASTCENFDYAAVQALKNIKDVLAGGPGINTVN